MKFPEFIVEWKSDVQDNWNKVGYLIPQMLEKVWDWVLSLIEAALNALSMPT
jgi:hypothetical protein